MFGLILTGIGVGVDVTITLRIIGITNPFVGVGVSVPAGALVGVTVVVGFAAPVIVVVGVPDVVASGVFVISAFVVDVGFVFELFDSERVPA
jgi:hypothetical protein